MSTANLQSALGHVILNNYSTLATISAVTYDYILTFSQEVEYIWHRPWTWVSTMFVIVRYIGLFWIMTDALQGSSFVSGPLEAMIYLASLWKYTVFLLATDLVMIMRVYAMWNRSRTILWILLFIYVVQIITTVGFDVIYSNLDNPFPVTIVRLSSLTFCKRFVAIPLVIGMVPTIPRLALATTLVFLTVVQTLRQSVEMYKATKVWQLNKYMQLLVKDGILYFSVNLLNQIIYLLYHACAANDPMALFLITCTGITFYPLIPRFIISIRELYDHDIRRGRIHIDTGFGILSQSNTGLDATVSAGRDHGPEEGGDLNVDNAGHIEVAHTV